MDNDIRVVQRTLGFHFHAATAVILFIAAWPALAERENLQRFPVYPVNKVLQPAELGTILDVVRLKTGRLVTVGTRGKIALSDDGGRTWSPIGSPLDVTLTAVTATAEGRLLAVGHEETILTSDDEGNTWASLQTNPTGGPLLKIRMITDRIGLILGARGVLYRTDDGGTRWTRTVLTTPNGFDASLFDALDTGKGTVIISAEAGLLYLSRDSGQQWKTIQSPYNGSLFGLVSSHGDAVVAYGMRGTVLLSYDDGEKWAIERPPGADSLFGGAARDGEIVLGGQDGTLLYASPGFPTEWRAHPLGSRATITAVLAMPPGDGWALATNHGLIRLPDPLSSDNAQ